MRTVVVLPTFNEVENIAAILAAIRANVPSADIIVVDDHSPDGTAAVAETVASELGQIKLLHRPGKHGLGSAYRNGFTMALDEGYDRIVSMDADFSHDPAHLPQFLEAIEHYDVVLGSRYLHGRVTVVNWPISRLLLSYYANVYARFVTGLPIADATGGFKCFRKEALAAIPLERVESNGYAFQIEMSFRAWKKGFRLGEIPIMFVDRDVGESKMSGKIVREAVWRVWRLRFLALFGKL